jgi:hypothetical protein
MLYEEIPNKEVTKDSLFTTPSLANQKGSIKRQVTIHVEVSSAPFQLDPRARPFHAFAGDLETRSG